MDRVMTRSGRFLAVGGVASVVLGLSALIWPGLSLAAFTALFGAFALVYGIGAIGTGLTLASRKSTEWVPFIVGGIGAVVISAITFLYPGVTDLALIYLVGAFAFATGVMQILAAMDIWGEVNGAAWLGLGGLASIVFGIIVAFHPGAGLLAMLWVFGVYAIAGGVSQLVASYRIHQFRGEVKAVAAAMRPSAV